LINNFKRELKENMSIFYVFFSGKFFGELKIGHFFCPKSHWGKSFPEKVFFFHDFSGYIFSDHLWC